MDGHPKGINHPYTIEMIRIDYISSATNPKIRTFLNLMEKSRLRKEMNLFVVEGYREVERAVEAGFFPKTLFLCGEILGEERLEAITRLAEKANAQCGMMMVPPFLYNKIAYRGGTEGVTGEFECQEKTLADLHLSEHPLIAVLESVEKPGNLGAVLRSADAAGADAVIVCDPLTDLYNPNIVRASTGAIFSRQVALATSEETISWLKKHQIRIYTAQLQDSKPYYDTDMKGGTAIVMGTEATGLTDLWRDAADAHIRIPMAGQADSLNVSVSASILLFEAVRQRSCH